MKLTTERKSIIKQPILGPMYMYKTTVYTLVSRRITHQKQKISAKKMPLLSSTLTLRRCHAA